MPANIKQHILFNLLTDVRQVLDMEVHFNEKTIF